MDALKAAKQAIADHDILYTGQELRSILANLVEYTERLLEKQRAERIKRATRMWRRWKRGESIESIAADLNITTARVYKLIASVK